MTAPDLRVMPIQKLTQGGGWRTEAMRSYSQHQLLWFTRGQGRITVSGITRGYGAHNAIFVPAGAMHNFQVTSQVYGTALFLSPQLDLGLPDRPCHLRIRDAQPQAELTQILDYIQREFENDHPGRDRAMLHHAGLLSVWLERQLNSNDDALVPKDAASRLALRYATLVERDFRTKKSVSHYARELGVTSTHLNRICKDISGQTASTFLASRKIAEARRLLADTRTPIKDIAAELGFTSAAYFTRAFHSRTGMAPGTFRRDG